MSTPTQTGIDASRRGFLRGRVGPTVAPLRPPWAVAEFAFVSRCTRCEGCQSACPTGIVVAGDGGFPAIDFKRGECTFCGVCVAACAPKALARTDDMPPRALRAVIGADCLAKANVVCRSCGDSCESQAIRFRPRLGAAALPELERDRCSGCGACVAPCPTAAIRMMTMQQPGVRT